MRCIHIQQRLCDLHAPQFIVAFHEQPTPASLAAFDRQLLELNGRSIGYLPEDAVLALLPWSAVTAVSLLPGDTTAPVCSVDPCIPLAYLQV